MGVKGLLGALEPLTRAIVLEHVIKGRVVGVDASIWLVWGPPRRLKPQEPFRPLARVILRGFCAYCYDVHVKLGSGS